MDLDLEWQICSSFAFIKEEEYCHPDYPLYQETLDEHYRAALIGFSPFIELKLLERKTISSFETVDGGHYCDNSGDAQKSAQTLTD